MNRNKGILTFQGHPEMTYEISKSLVDHDSGSYKAGVNPHADIQLSGIEASHDGSEAWDRIMAHVTTNCKP